MVKSNIRMSFPGTFKLESPRVVEVCIIVTFGNPLDKILIC